MFEKGRYATSLASTGLRLAIIALFVLLSSCNGDSGSDGDKKPADEVVDLCPLDDQKLVEGVCGCGVADTDTDTDGTPDCQDACPDDPGTVPDRFGFCGNTGDSATVVAGEALLLSVNGASFSIPADALVPGTVVTLAEIDPGLLDELPNGPNETLITPIYALEFSEAQPSLGLMMFALDIPAAVVTGLYARIKVEGGLDAEGQTDTDWLAQIGEYDATQSLLTLKLYATASRLLIAGLSSSPPAAPLAATGVITQKASSPQLMSDRLFATAAAEVLDANIFHVWNEYGWALLCEPKMFKKFDSTSCDPDSPDYLPMMNRLAPQLYDADKRLTDLNFPRGSVQLVTLEGIKNSGHPYIIYDPDGRSVATTNSSGKVLAYVLAWADPNKKDTALGSFSPSTSRINFDFDTGDDGTVIHELMHAVQRVEIHNMYGNRNKWIREGLASATRPFSKGYSGPAAQDFRYGLWRDWKYSLTNYDNINHYKLVEFWLSLTGDLSSIPGFYDNLRGDTSSTETNSQLQVDEALTATGLPSLAAAYTGLILTRNGQAGYKYCEGEGQGGEQNTFKICGGSSCSDTVEELYPVSAQCFVQEIAFDECDGEPAEIEVTLEPDSPNPNMKLIVDGVVYDANTPVPFPNDGKRYWVINTDLEPVTSSPGPTATLVFKNESPPCNLKLLRQRKIARSNSLIAVVQSLFERDISEHEYYSFEDGSQQSYREDLESVTSGSDDDNSIPDPTLTFVEPIGFGANNMGYATDVSFTRQPGGEFYTTSASVLNNTEMSYDEASRTFTAVGELESLARDQSDAYHPDVRSQVRAQNQYYFETKGATAELTVTWDCTLSLVSIHYLDPGTFIAQSTIYNTSNFPNSSVWECGTRQFTIGANRIIRIDMVSANETGTNSSAFHNEGGSFEFSLKSIEEPEAP